MGFLDFLFKKEERIGGDYSENNTNNGNESIDLESVTGDFLMVIEDSFTITGRGTIVTGTITSGRINVGDTVKIRHVATGEVSATTVAGIEMFRKLLDTAGVGENVGILLRGVKRDEIESGDILFQGNMSE